MKTKYIFNTLILLGIPVLFWFVITGFRSIGSEKNESAGSNEVNRTYISFAPQQKDFTNFILNTDYYDTPRSWDMQNFINYYRGELNFNGVHIYDKDIGNLRHGKFNIDLTGPQIDSMQALINMAQTRGLKSVFERTKISRLCYGQRLVYEAEGGNNGFSYYRRIDTAIADSGGYVVHACPDCPPSSSHSAGMLCDSIYENMQHTDLYYFPPNSSDTSNWHVKPRMRIKKSDFDNPSLQNTPVVRINTVNFSGDTIKRTILRVRNFDVNQSGYDGQYIDKYTFGPNDTNLQVSGGFGADGLNHGYTGSPNYNAEASRVDFKVYWFGQVEVWFDKMTVDDEIANGLFAGTYVEYIIDETSPAVFLSAALMLKNNEFNISNYMAVNYVMNVMYNKLQNQAVPFSLK